MLRKYFVAGLILSVASCLAQTKEPINPEVVAVLQIGKATQTEVIEFYGNPQKRMISGDLQGTCYVHYGWGDVQLLYLQFDQSGILKAKHLDDEKAQTECGSLNQTVRSSGRSSFSNESCTMDIQCGVGRECVSGVCTGGIGPQFNGKCVTGSFGKKVCTNNGESCFQDLDCM